MTTAWHRAMIGATLGLFAALASLEIIAERTRPDHQLMEVSGQDARTTGHRRVSGVELPEQGRAPREASRASWRMHLGRMDEALAKQDLSAAVRAWHDAYGAALGSRRWEAMVDVGDAYLRIGEAAGSRRGWEAKARESYLNALFRARHQGAVEGVLRAAEAFAALGDREVVDQCLRIAEGLATRDPEAQADVRKFRERLAGGVPRIGDDDLNQPETPLRQVSVP